MIILQSLKIKLISIGYTEDEIGNQVPVETVTEVWAEEIGVRQSEFYNAAVTGLKPEKTFIIWANEYSGQTKIEADGVKYKLIRAYNNPSKSEMMELVCEKVSADG
ncbi:MAG TPA: phage head-tail adapter protein [Pelotomaculum sp.]|nr:phage head-tail adapter protein [Pelotomaculum sp.]